MELLQCFMLFVANTLCTKSCTKLSTTLEMSSPVLIVIEMTSFVNFSTIFHVKKLSHLVTWHLKPPLVGILFH